MEDYEATILIPSFLSGLSVLIWDVSLGEDFIMHTHLFTVGKNWEGAQNMCVYVCV